MRKATGWTRISVDINDQGDIWEEQRVTRKARNRTPRTTGSWNDGRAARLHMNAECRTKLGNRPIIDRGHLSYDGWLDAQFISCAREKDHVLMKKNGKARRNSDLERIRATCNEKFLVIINWNAIPLIIIANWSSDIIYYLRKIQPFCRTKLNYYCVW